MFDEDPFQVDFLMFRQGFVQAKKACPPLSAHQMDNKVSTRYF